MALKDGSGYYTKFTFVENEQVLVRRIHRLEIQAWDGRLYAVEGKQLPDYIGGTSGAGVKNAHVLQILVSKQALKAGLPGGPKLVRWPGQRRLDAHAHGKRIANTDHWHHQDGSARLLTMTQASGNSHHSPVLPI